MVTVSMIVQVPCKRFFAVQNVSWVAAQLEHVRSSRPVRMVQDMLVRLPWEIFIEVGRKEAIRGPRHKPMQGLKEVMHSLKISMLCLL